VPVPETFQVLVNSCTRQLLACYIIIATARDSDSSSTSNKQHENKPVSALGVLIDGKLLIVNTIMAHTYLFILEERWTSYPIIFLHEVCAK